ncbi:MAG: PepSY domain-containing protein [Cyclobacteriaceae bacterium]
MKSKAKRRLSRKIHRYMGLFIGVQFLFWTIGGLYFSWTNIDEIHGDHILTEGGERTVASTSLGDASGRYDIREADLRFIGDRAYLWVNDEKLVDVQTWEAKDSLTREEALTIADSHIKSDYNVADVEYITEAGDHHEYRGRPLPAWVVHYEGDDNISAYISAREGTFQRVRHDSWRYFDFLWMLHTMDYNGRDDFNNWLLRAFSILGLITILSGFTLFYYTSPTIRKLTHRRLPLHS